MSEPTVTVHLLKVEIEPGEKTVRIEIELVGGGALMLVEVERAKLPAPSVLVAFLRDAAAAVAIAQGIELNAVEAERMRAVGGLLQ